MKRQYDGRNVRSARIQSAEKLCYNLPFKKNNEIISRKRKFENEIRVAVKKVRFSEDVIVHEFIYNENDYAGLVS